MKKLIITILITILCLPIFANAANKDIDIYLFYGRECPHCAQLEKFLNSYLPENPDGRYRGTQ